MKQPSLWMRTSYPPSFPPLDRRLEVDALVVGGGIAGVTAALLLQRAGKKVVLIEARRVGQGETGHTTAHLTEILDTRYYNLEAKFGRENAALAAASARAAIDRIEAFANELGDASCSFTRLPGYLYAETYEQRQSLEQEYESLRRVGVAAAWAAVVPLPFGVNGALRIDRQAQLHPLHYLNGLTSLFVAAQGQIFEDSPMLTIEEYSDSCTVTTEKGVIKARDVLVMTNSPVSSKFAIHTKVASYRTYALAARLPQDRIPEGLFWDLAEPYHYLRGQETPEGSFVIIGGEDHKTGQKRDTSECFRDLDAYAHSRFSGCQIEHRWSGQIIEPADGLPFIGRSPNTMHTYIATGFSGTGMTFGTLSGMMLCDAILGVENRWAELYDAKRVKVMAQARRYVTENADYPAYLAHDRFARGEVDRPEDIPMGEGRLLRNHGKMLAVYRDDDGLSVRSAVCTHMGCNVRWNKAESSWDCPCHGSRFDTQGQVLNGPAVKGLPEEHLEAPAAERAPQPTAEPLKPDSTFEPGEPPSRRPR